MQPEEHLQEEEEEEYIDQTEIQEELEIGEQPYDDEDMRGMEEQEGQEDMTGMEGDGQQMEFHDDSIQGFFEHKGMVKPQVWSHFLITCLCRL